MGDFGDPERFRPGRVDPRPREVGDEALANVLLGPSRVLAGGRMLDGTSAREVLGRLGLGVFEAGCLVSPVHAFGALSVIGAAYGNAQLGVPGTDSIRLRSVSAILQTGAGAQQPTTFIGVGFNPLPRALTLVTGAAVGPAAALADCPWTVVDGDPVEPVSEVAAVVDVVLNPGDIITAGAIGMAVGDELILMVTYQLAPQNCRPPF